MADIYHQALAHVLAYEARRAKETTMLFEKRYEWSDETMRSAVAANLRAMALRNHCVYASQIAEMLGVEKRQDRVEAALMALEADALVIRDMEDRWRWAQQQRAG